MFCTSQCFLNHAAGHEFNKASVNEDESSHDELLGATFCVYTKTDDLSDE